MVLLRNLEKKIEHIQEAVDDGLFTHVSRVVRLVGFRSKRRHYCHWTRAQSGFRCQDSSKLVKTLYLSTTGGHGMANKATEDSKRRHDGGPWC